MMLPAIWRMGDSVILVLFVCFSFQRITSEITFLERRKDKNDIFGYVSGNCGNIAGETGRINESFIKCKCHNSYSTFLYKRTTCVGNSNVTALLKQPGSSNVLRLDGQDSEESPYIVLDLQTSGDKKFYTHQVNQIDGSNCKIKTTLQYIDDRLGTEKNFNADIFSIDTTSKKLEWTSLPKNSTLHGRILRLTPVGCTFSHGSSQLPNPCILLKAKGTIRFTATSSTTPSSSKTSSTLATPSVHHSRSSSVIVTSTLYTNTPIYSSSMPISLSSDKPTPTPTRHGSSSVTSSAIITPVKPTDSGHRNHGNLNTSKSESSPTGAIVGAILAVVGVIAIIVLVIIWRRRKSRQNEEKKKDTNKDNPAYGKREAINLSNPNKENSEFEYDYAAVDGDPRLSNGKPPPGIYQSLVHDPNTNRESVYTPLDRQQGNPNEESASYDTIDHPVFKPAKKPMDPQYNVLQRPNKNKPVQDHTYLEPGAQIDPVYNVLEDPNSGGAVDEPEYNVLEGPNSGGANDYPDYNVLEDPNAQYEPEYHILEDPQNNGPPKRHPSSRDNIGYASTIDLKPRGGSPVYAAPDGPISEPTYQPLTVNAPDDSVYQPLDRTSRNIPDNNQPVYHVLEGGVSDA